MDRQRAIENVKEICAILPDAFLSNGSLLGAVREGNIIAHDLDTDVGLHIDHFNEDLVPTILDAGFSIDHVFGSPEKGLEFSFKRDNIKTDLFFYYSDDKNWWHYVHRYDEMKRYVFPRPTGFTHMQFGGEWFKVPSNATEWLTASYGLNWGLPVEKWDYWNSPHNIHE